ncbi:hypothetical protein KFK09_019397 [Dendrobium nobile]|uniref:Inositol polyphosphate-related phosphatase domain-containing protein n=1 Tax=Dendrobium nobile TaxID=94219 RepID=A0A8T3AQ55_DENNO|nr:hypothetical protein KFK09_019397 [Dendrobium nobile]
MRDENSTKSKLSWSKSLVRKWFNIKCKAQDFNVDDGVGRDIYCRKNPDLRWQTRFDCNEAQVTDTKDCRMFVATWNVGGKSPPSCLNLDWLHSSPPADIYVLGFQEIVPLSAGNVLGTEDNDPASKWISIIRKTLNNLPGACGYDLDIGSDSLGSSTGQKNLSFFHRRSLQSLNHSSRIDGDMIDHQAAINRRFSVCDQVIFGSRPSDFDPSFTWGVSSDDENVGVDSLANVCFSPISYGYGVSTNMEDRERCAGLSRYCLVVNKQMVGIFLTVWVRCEIRDDVKNMKVSHVGRGLMGYLGNKGSISVSISLHKTTFCFICSHLTSGQKGGDELRRNYDVLEILRKTRFPQFSGQGDVKSPETILEHDRVIWLGDLNYRIALSYQSTKALIEMQNWKLLLEKDQLRIEQRSGRVFVGWNEGRIYFPPTYKFSTNSDRYSSYDIHPKAKRRTPAWCDRILWYGRGLRQLSYVRGDSRFSDHRPVYSTFDAEVELINYDHPNRSMNFMSSHIEVEELLPYSFRCNEFNFY